MPKKDLIDNIKDSLKSFEETYDHSEWENFQKKRRLKSRRPISLFLKLAGIAASLFLITYASVRFYPLLERSKEHRISNSPKEISNPKKGEEINSLTTIIKDSIPDIVDKSKEKTIRITESTPQTLILKESIFEKQSVIATKVTSIKKAGLIADSTTIKGFLRPHYNVPIDYLVDRNKKHLKPVKTKKNKDRQTKPFLGGGLNFFDIDFKKVDIGLNITPVIANKGISVGGGASAQIPLSNPFTAEIGVSYMNLKLGMDLGVNEADTNIHQVIGVRNSVSIISIPLSLNYSISESFSASLGILPFKVVRNQQTNILQTNKWVWSGDTTKHLAIERTRLRQADSLYVGNSYLGFAQVSAQYSPPFLKKRNIVLSPFISVPIGRIRKDEHHWLNGGVSLRLYLR